MSPISANRCGLIIYPARNELCYNDLRYMLSRVAKYTVLACEITCLRALNILFHNETYALTGGWYVDVVIEVLRGWAVKAAVSPLNLPLLAYRFTVLSHLDRRALQPETP